MMLFDRWSRLVAASAPASTPAERARCFAVLDRAYSEDHRAYHTWQHIEECLEWLDRVPRPGIPHQADVLSPRRDTLEYAIFYHDAVYDPARPDNEERSARLAAGELAGVGLTREYTNAVTELVLETAHLARTDRPAGSAAPAADIVSADLASPGARALMHDIDLAIFASPLERVIEYDRQIRIEYSSIDPAPFRERRARVLSAFLEREHIYRTAFFLDRCEETARAAIRTLLDLFYSK